MSMHPSPKPAGPALETGTPIPPSGSILGHPGGLFLLFIVEMWERFSYYGMRALLVLYLVTVIAAPDLKPGVYNAMLQLKYRAEVAEQDRVGHTADEVDKQFPWSMQHYPIQVVAGNDAPAPSKPFGDMNGSVVVEPSNPVTITKDGGAWSGAPFTYTIRNSSSEPVEFSLSELWPTEEDGAGNSGHDVVITTEDVTEATESLKKGDISQQTFDRRNTGSSGVVAGVIKPGESRLVRVDIRTENGGRGWKSEWANTLYGWYTGMAYLIPILGGLVADRFLGTHRSMLVGGLIIAMGHIVLAVSGIGDWANDAIGLSIFVFGLSLIVMGTGHFKPCVSVMVGQLYRPGDGRRDGGFSIFYMGINLGAFICAFVCGTLGETVGWHWGFGSAAVGMILGLITYLIGRPKLLKGVGMPPEGASSAAPVAFGFLSIAISACVAWLFHVGTLGKVDGLVNLAFGSTLGVSIIAAVILAVIGWFVAIQRPGERGPVLSIFVFILFNVFFWMAFEQAGSSLNLFAEQKTDRTMAGWTMPTTWFQSINPLLIILLAPVFGAIWSALGRRRLNPSQSLKISLGLSLLGIGYLFMVWAGVLTAQGGKVGIYFLVATYFFHTLGELCLSPTGLSYVTKVAPVRFMSLLMGVWFLSSFVAGVAGGKVAALVERIEKGEIQLPWKLGGQADFYMLFVVSSFAGAVLILVLWPVMKRVAPERD